jgi:hypothetical protein
VPEVKLVTRELLTRLFLLTRILVSMCSNNDADSLSTGPTQTCDDTAPFCISYRLVFNMYFTGFSSGRTTCYRYSQSPGEFPKI